VGEYSSKPLQGKRVVVTRATEQSEALVKALREQGAEPLLMPMVTFAPPDDVQAVDEVMRGIERYDWLFLTSQNALRALQERCEKLGVALVHRMRGVRIAVVGPTTAEAAKDAGLSVEHVAASRYGTALAQELAGSVEGKWILLPRSDRADPELVEKLEGLGAKVKEIVVYKTAKPEGKGLEEAEKLVREGAEAVLFFSPSSVVHFRDILGEDRFQAFSRQALFAAIGPVTENALRKAKIERVVMAGDVTVSAVIAALTEYFLAKTVKLPAGAKPK
jgi:uroporphyrinogen-III synthase